MDFSKPISFRSDDYMFSYQDVPPHRLNMHLHKMYELLWLIHGDVSYIIDDSAYRLSPGDMVITRPNELHTIIFHSEQQYRRCFLQFSPQFANFMNASLTSALDRMPRQGQKHVISAEAAERYRLPDMFYHIADCTTNTPPFWHTSVQATLALLLIRLSAIISENAPAQTDGEPSDRIDKIAAYLSQNTNVTLDELAQRFYINKYHLCHAFKSRFGITVKEFVNTRRIARAKQLIEDGRSITELCYMCGFNDYTTFYKTFKKLTGKTPSDFFAHLRSPSAENE